MSTWRIIITREIIKVRATCCSFLLPARTRNMKARFSVANDLGASSNTTSVKPHEFFDHTALWAGRLLAPPGHPGAGASGLHTGGGRWSAGGAGFGWVVPPRPGQARGRLTNRHRRPKTTR